MNFVDRIDEKNIAVYKEKLTQRKRAVTFKIKQQTRYLPWFLLDRALHPNQENQDLPIKNKYFVVKNALKSKG